MVRPKARRSGIDHNLTSFSDKDAAQRAEGSPPVKLRLRRRNRDEEPSTGVFCSAASAATMLSPPRTLVLLAALCRAHLTAAEVKPRWGHLWFLLELGDNDHASVHESYCEKCLLSAGLEMTFDFGGIQGKTMHACSNRVHNRCCLCIDSYG